MSRRRSPVIVRPCPVAGGRPFKRSHTMVRQLVSSGFIQRVSVLWWSRRVSFRSRTSSARSSSLSCPLLHFRRSRSALIQFPQRSLVDPRPGATCVIGLPIFTDQPDGPSRRFRSNILRFPPIGELLILRGCLHAERGYPPAVGILGVSRGSWHPKASPAIPDKRRPSPKAIGALAAISQLTRRPDVSILIGH